jgi:glycine/D-amino acid oxidase-like deaminating enzyme
MARVVVVGAGIFGVTAAIVLRTRGHDVTIVDPGPIPHPLAESTDISKIVRLDYGADEAYTEMMESALDGWRRWNARWTTPLFHETGVLFVSKGPMEPGGFEHDSYEVLQRRGHRLERLDAQALKARFPQWNAARFVDGYYNPEGGWAESGAVVTELAREAAALGVRVAGDVAVASLVTSGSRIEGVLTADGVRIAGDIVVVAAGAWTQSLVPSMAPHLRAVGQPVFHLEPAGSEAFEARVFPVFGADIARTGWYGFPIHHGVVKIANHGVGRQMHPESVERLVTEEQHDELRAFLVDAFPGLAHAPIVRTRLCVYCDTWDQHFWIAPDPTLSGLVVAAGGSGHAFKFAPVVGSWIADAVDGKAPPKFRHRPAAPHVRGEERARHQG